MNLEAWIKKRNWQDIILIFILVFFLILQQKTISQYQQLPAPLYGGDKYLQLGAITHAADGGNTLDNFRNSDPVPNYMPLYTVIVGGSARLFNLEPMNAMFFFSYIFVALEIIILYFLGSVLFKNKSIGLIFTMIYLPFIVIIKYGHFARWTIFPLFFLVLFLAIFENDIKKKWIYSGITGVVYGLTSLAHGTSFPSLSVLIFCSAVYLLFFHYLKREKKKFNFNKKLWKQDLKKNIVSILLIAIPGFLIAQLYWFPLIKNLIFGSASSSAALLQYMNTNLTNLHPFPRLLKMLFFTFDNIIETILSVLTILSVPVYFFIKKYSKAVKFSLLILLGTIFVILAFSIFEVVFGMNLQITMGYTAAFWSSIVRLFAAGLILSIVFKMLKKKPIIIAYSIVIVVLALLFTFHYFSYKDYVFNDRWHKVGTSPLSPHLVEVSNYLRQNSDVYDVVLTNKELAFSISALSGRKLVAQPVGQKNLLYDFNTRERDLATMLYGNESADDKRKELFAKYRVKYFYWDNYWISSEFRFDEQGRLSSLFDPIELLNNDENKAALDAYGITYLEEHTELNPNYRGVGVPKFDVLIVLPALNLTHPWSPSLDKFLQIEKDIRTPQNQPIAQLYKVVY